MPILFYIIVFIVSVALLFVGKWIVFRSVVRTVLAKNIAFAGKNTLLITEFCYKFLIQMIVVLVGVVLCILFTQPPSMWLLVVFAILPLFENVTAYLENTRNKSPRPKVYLMSGILADALGLALGYYLFAVLLLSYQPIGASSGTTPSLFWQSIPKGFEIIYTWEFWAIVMMSAFVSVIFVKDNPDQKNESEQSTSSKTLFGLIIRCLLMSFGVALLIPHLLGLPDLSVIDLLLSRHLIWILVAPLLVVVSLLILSIVPYLGSVIALSRPAQVFVEGLIPFLFLSYNLTTQSSIYPGLFATIGYLAIAVLLGFATVATVGVFVSQWKQGTGTTPSGFIIWSGSFLSSFCGIIALSMYATYVRLVMTNV